MAVSDSAQDEGLVRVIGTGALGLSVVNMVVGAGNFVLPSLVAAVRGPWIGSDTCFCSVTVALVFTVYRCASKTVDKSMRKTR